MITGQKTVLLPFNGEWATIQKWMYDDYYKFFFKNMPELLKPEQLSKFDIIMGMQILMIYDRGEYLASIRDGFTIYPKGMVTWDNTRILAKTCDLGVVIDKDFTGKNYGAEACFLLLNYLFNRLGFHKVCVSTAAIAEETSEKAVKKLGFVYEGISREHLFIDGEWKDEKRFSLLKEEFECAYKIYKKSRGELWEKEKEGDKNPLMKKS